jgi:hypothetical protein
LDRSGAYGIAGGTAYLRLDLLPPDARSAVQEDFRHSVDARLDAYRRLPDMQAALAGLEKASALPSWIWQQVVAGGQSPGAADQVLMDLRATLI